MPSLPPILLAALTGLGFGLLLAIPVGPVNLTIMNEGSRRGFRQAALIASGALLMEAIYCALAFSGFGNYCQRESVKAVMEIGSFLFMLGLGLWFLTAKPSRLLTKIEERIEEKLHPTSAFMTGFVRVLGNLGVPVSWVLLGTYFISHDWVKPTLAGKSTCVLGVTTGTGLWFFGIAYAASLGYKKISEKTLLRMERGSGIGLLVLAFAHGCEMVWKLHYDHHL